MSVSKEKRKGKEHNTRSIKRNNYEYLHNPHAITILILIIIILLSSNIYYDRTIDDRDIESRIIVGFKFSIVTFIVLGALIYPTGPFVRPHPIVWNIFFSVSLVYFLFLVFLGFQTAEFARKIIRHLDPTAGEYFELKKYAENCDFNFKNVWGNVYDRFFVSHFLGWVGKTLVIRNRVLCWCMSIFWEMLEFSLIFFFPNFAECWWDSIILDILIANAIGIEVGYFLCKKLEMKKYNWTTILETKSVWGKVKRAFLQFSPESWTRVQWHTTSTIKRFVAVNFLCASLLVFDINTFTLKAVLYIPDDSNLNIYRLVLWFGLGIPAIRQLYFYITNPECKRFGPTSTLATLIIFAELFISVKLSSEKFPAIPAESYYLWALYSVIYFSIFFFMISKLKKKRD